MMAPVFVMARLTGAGRGEIVAMPLADQPLAWRTKAVTAAVPLVPACRSIVNALESALCTS
jgi:hypothetical protein